MIPPPPPIFPFLFFKIDRDFKYLDIFFFFLITRCIIGGKASENFQQFIAREISRNSLVP